MRTFRILLLWLALLLAHYSYSQNREVHILAANDMHAAIESFPQFAAIADSLRELTLRCSSSLQATTVQAIRRTTCSGYHPCRW